MDRATAQACTHGLCSCSGLHASTAQLLRHARMDCAAAPVCTAGPAAIHACGVLGMCMACSRTPRNVCNAPAHRAACPLCSAAGP
eukprot:155396-Chlamydomonas_euryale.AAC.4